MKRKPIPKKVIIRRVKMSELSDVDRELLKKGMADIEAGRVKKVTIPNPKGFKIVASQQVTDAIAAEELGEILKHIVNHAAASRRRRNTKPKSVRRRKP